MQRSTGATEPDIVVPVGPLIPVAIGRTTIVIIVVPRPAPQNGVFRTTPEANIAFFK